MLADATLVKGIQVLRSSEDDVLGRVRRAVDAGVCVKITGDCLLTDPASTIREFFQTRATSSYVANTTGPVCCAPRGLDIQIFDADALRTTEREANDPEAREHVCVPFYRYGIGGRRRLRFVPFFPAELGRTVWLAVDYREDYELIRLVYCELAPRNALFGAQSVIGARLARSRAVTACFAPRGWE